MITIIDAILSIDSNSQVTVVGQDIDTATLTWNSTEISKADIKTKMAELQTAYDNNEYQRKRDAEYPSIKDQLDKIYHEGIDKWKEDMIKPVKDKHPKD